MENLLLSFNVVAPLFLYMAAGWLMRRFGVLDEKACRDISRAVFYVPLPALCFQGIIDTDFDSIFQDPFMLYTVAGICLVFALCMLLVPKFCKVNARRGVLVQAILRSNDGVFGLAVASALMEGRMGLMTLAVAIGAPLFNILSVADMEYFRGGRVQFGKVLRRMLLNPIVIGCGLAILFNLCRVRMPALIDGVLTKFAGVSAPMGFLALGGTLSFQSLKRDGRAIGVISLLRLMVIPSVFLLLMYLLGYRGDQLLVTLIMFGAPTAMSTYTMACAMGGDESLASGAVAVTSLLSILTIFVFVFLLKQWGIA